MNGQQGTCTYTRQRRKEAPLPMFLSSTAMLFLVVLPAPSFLFPILLDGRCWEHTVGFSTIVESSGRQRLACLLFFACRAYICLPCPSFHSSFPLHLSPMPTMPCHSLNVLFPIVGELKLESWKRVGIEHITQRQV